MGRCVFKKKWLEATDLTGRKIGTWAKEGENDENMICFICNRTFLITKGFQSINQHANTAIHLLNVKTKLNVRQLTFTANFTSSEPLGNVSSAMVCKADEAMRSEIIWCLKNIQSNYSAASTQGITNVFKAMFNNIPEGFSLSYTKLSYYITEALGPYCRQKLLADVGDNYYSLQYDETTNSKGLKELQVRVRYWSEQENKVEDRNLENFFLGSATAEILKKHLLESIDNANLLLKNLLTLGSDGPNVNKKVLTLMNEEMKVLNRKTLINVGTCTIHLIHNAFLKGLQAFDSSANDFVISVYYFFNGWPQEDFEEIQNKLKVPNHRFLKHVPSRWLTIGPAIERVIEQYDALLEYFIEFVPKHRKQLISTKKYKDIIKCLKENAVKTDLLFVKYVAELFTRFTATFQNTGPLIHILYDELKHLAVNLLSKILKSTVSIDFRDTAKASETLFTISNLLPIQEVHCSENVKIELQKFSKLDKLHFLKQCQKFFIESSKHILKKSPLILKNLKYFSWLNPQKVADMPFYYLSNICNILPITIDKDVLLNEFTAFKLLDLKNSHNISNQRIDLFWGSVEKEVERGFSLSGRVLSEDRSSMSLKTLNNKLHIQDTLKLYNNRADVFPITKELINMARGACRSYKAYLDKQASDKKKNEEEMKRNEREKEQELLARKTLEENKKRIEEIEKELKVVSKEKESAKVFVDKLLNEANKKMEAAIKSQDMVEVKVAQAMLSTALEKRQNESNLQKEADKMCKTIYKRNSSIISTVISKKPKL